MLPKTFSIIYFHYSPWKYLINLAGSELPLYSVDELSDRLTKHNVKIATDSGKTKMDFSPARPRNVDPDATVVKVIIPCVENDS